MFLGALARAGSGTAPLALPPPPPPRRFVKAATLNALVKVSMGGVCWEKGDGSRWLERARACEAKLRAPTDGKQHSLSNARSTHPSHPHRLAPPTPTPPTLSAASAWARLVSGAPPPACPAPTHFAARALGAGLRRTTPAPRAGGRSRRPTRRR